MPRSSGVQPQQDRDGGPELTMIEQGSKRAGWASGGAALVRRGARRLMAVIAVVASIVVTFGIGAAVGHGTASPGATPAATMTAISRIVTAVPPTTGVGRTQPTSTGGSQWISP
jgi:hypothetical protein